MRLIKPVTSGVVGSMSKDSKAESRPVIVLEYFSGEGSYEDWIDQFESMAETNCWNDEQKLM